MPDVCTTTNNCLFLNLQNFDFQAKFTLYEGSSDVPRSQLINHYTSEQSRTILGRAQKMVQLHVESKISQNTTEELVKVFFIAASIVFVCIDIPTRQQWNN